MSAYSVGIARTSGRKVWWVKWQMASHDMMQSHEHIRDATAEESALMSKVEWNTDTADDCAKLRSLLAD